jgi:hypothetical protein
MVDNDTRRRINNHNREHYPHPFKAFGSGCSDFVVLFSRFRNFDDRKLEEALDLIDSVLSGHTDCLSCSAKILAFCEAFTRDRLPQRHEQYKSKFNEWTVGAERDYRREIEEMINSAISNSENDTSSQSKP